jgi:gamma-glutamylcyclotransferase
MGGKMKYFAYGSNMLEERLKAADRIPNAIFISVGSVCGYKLFFNKKSTDKSGKCNIVKTNVKDDIIYGVIFDVPEDKKALDNVEGEGYHEESNIPVIIPDGKEINMAAYVANSDVIDESLIPYDWYYKLVVSGAEQHKLPVDYVNFLKSFPNRIDPIPTRKTKLDAEKALNAYSNNLHT